MRLALPLCELEQVQRAFDVDLVRGDGGEFGAGGEQRGEMEDAIDFELGEDAIEQPLVEDRAALNAQHPGHHLKGPRFESKGD